jgi:hypothetical protein
VDRRPKAGFHRDVHGVEHAGSISHPTPRLHVLRRERAGEPPAERIAVLEKRVPGRLRGRHLDALRLGADAPAALPAGAFEQRHQVRPRHARQQGFERLDEDVATALVRRTPQTPLQLADAFVVAEHRDDREKSSQAFGCALLQPAQHESTRVTTVERGAQDDGAADPLELPRIESLEGDRVEVEIAQHR